MPRYAAQRIEFHTPVIKGTSRSWVRNVHQSGYDAFIDETARLVILKPQVAGSESERIPFEGNVRSYVLTAQVEKTEA